MRLYRSFGLNEYILAEHLFPQSLLISATKEPVYGVDFLPRDHVIPINYWSDSYIASLTHTRLQIDYIPYNYLNIRRFLNGGYFLRYAGKASAHYWPSCLPGILRGLTPLTKHSV